MSFPTQDYQDMDIEENENVPFQQQQQPQKSSEERQPFQQAQELVCCSSCPCSKMAGMFSAAIIAQVSWLSNFADSQFEWCHLLYLRYSDAWATVQEKYNNSIVYRSMVAVFLLLFGSCSWIAPFLTLFAAIRVTLWPRFVSFWNESFVVLVKKADENVRMDLEILQNIQNFDAQYFSGCALYVAREGHVSIFLREFGSVCDSNFVFGICRLLAMTVFVISACVACDCTQSVLVGVYIAQYFLHDVLFSSQLFHACFYQAFQANFKQEFAHFAKICAQICVSLLTVCVVRVVFDCTIVIGTFYLLSELVLNGRTISLFNQSIEIAIKTKSKNGGLSVASEIVFIACFVGIAVMAMYARSWIPFL